MDDVETAKRALALLDLTDLGEAATEEGLHDLCGKALSGPVRPAAICIWPRFVAKARAILGAEPLRIATVINFPLGEVALDEVIRQAEAALTAGTDEIDLVMPWRAFLSGDELSARRMIEVVKGLCRDGLLKVILETGEYPDQRRVAAAAKLAILSGADFIKTSTGKTAHSASLEAVETMLKMIETTPVSRRVGLKPSGGIRTLDDARSYLALADTIMSPHWATPATFRFGASGLHQVLLDAIAGKAAAGGTREAGGRY